MNTTSIQIFAEAMKYTNPSAYSSHVPKNLIAKFPFLEKLNSKNNYGYVSNMNTSLVQSFSSKGGQKFTVFVKHRKYGKDIYLDLIAPRMKTSLYAETWMNGGAKDLPSECTSQYKVVNIEELNVAGNQFKNSKDHSKWTIASDSKNPILCVGDINRQGSQTQRGGGAVCLKNEHIWNLYYKSVKGVQNCGTKSG